MATLTIPPKFQVVIPKAIRARLGLSPGQKVQAVLYGNRIELIPPSSRRSTSEEFSRASIPGFLVSPIAHERRGLERVA